MTTLVETIIANPSRTRTCTDNELVRPRFSPLFDTVNNHSHQLKRGNSHSSETSSYLIASAATSPFRLVLVPTETTATPPTATPVVGGEAEKEAEAEICPTCKHRTLSSDSVPIYTTMQAPTPSTSPRPGSAPFGPPPSTTSPRPGSAPFAHAPFHPARPGSARLAPASSPSPLGPGDDPDRITPVARCVPASRALVRPAPPERHDANKPDRKHRRPRLRRSLSSLWKILDPPQLRSKTGVLHDLALQDADC